MLLRRIGEVSPVPPGYGVAWIEADRCVVVCAPIGLNVVFGAARAAWLWLKMCYVPDVALAAFERGYQKGKEHGRGMALLEGHDRLRSAYRQGIEHAHAWLLADLDIRRAEREKETVQ